MAPQDALQAGRVPLFVGVTGHRDLRPEDVPRLTETVRSALNDLAAAHPHSPLVILTALAEGADRLVARVALTSKIPYLAVLPMPRAAYVADFVEPGSAANLHELLAAACGEPLVLPLPEGVTEARLASLEEGREDRRTQYGALRDWLVRHSQVILALWDGKGHTTLEGTSGVVRAALNGSPQEEPSTAASPRLREKDPIDLCPVVQIVTPRASNPAVANAFARVVRRPRDTAAADGDEGLRHANLRSDTSAFVDRVNEDLADLRADAGAGHRLCSTGDERTLPPLARRLHADFQRVEELAVLGRKKRERVFRWLGALTLVALFSLEVYAHLCSSTPALLLAFPALLSGAWLWLRAARRRGDETRHLDYRALAEALRVQFHWVAGGVDADVAAEYPAQQAPDLDAVRMAARGMALWARVDADTGGTATADDATRLALVRKEWVREQARWLPWKQRVLARELAVAEHAVRALWIGGAGGALLLALAQWCGRIDAGEPAHHLAIVAITLSLALGAALKVHTEKKALPETMGQYARLAPLYLTAASQLDALLAAGEPTVARRLLLELGREALAENGAWTILHRERKPEVQAGG